MNLKPVKLAMFAVLTAGIVSAEDWPRFRGPNGCAMSESAVPVEFGMDQNLKWKLKLPGRGVSSPIVVGDKVFVTCYSGYGVPGGSEDIKDLKRHLVCLDRASGKELWRRSVDGVAFEDPYRGMGVPAHGYASHTPVCDGTNVFCFYGKAGVVAYDLAGKKLWHKHVGKESGRQEWGSAASPIEFADLVIVNASDESEALVALEKKTGKEKWRAEASGLAGVWGTPVLMKTKKSTEVVIAVPYEIWGLDANTGAFNWYSRGPEDRSTSHSVIPVGGMVVSMGGRGGNSIAVKPGGKDEVKGDKIVWQERASGRFASPVAYNDVIFQVSGDIVASYSAKDGKRIKQARIPGASSTSRGGGFGSPGGSRGGRGPGGDRDSGSNGARERGGERRGPGDEGKEQVVPTAAQRGGQDRRGSFGGRSSRGGGFGRSIDYASPVVAGGKLYVVMNSGHVHVFEANAEMKLISTNDLSEDNSGFAGSPAVSDGMLILRSHSAIYCFSK